MTNPDRVVQDVVWLDPDVPPEAPAGTELIADNTLDIGDVYVPPKVEGTLVGNVPTEGTQAI